MPPSRDLAFMVKRKFNIKNVIVTMGKEGTAISNEQGSGAIHIPSYLVEAVDATGAGDAFNGGLVVALAQGKNLDDAVKGLPELEISILPPEYCFIFDLSKSHYGKLDPVIEHFQASRQFR
jgi:hypothetical protein